MPMNELASEDVAERIGAFLDEYICLPDGGKVPRNIPYFKEAFQILFKNGATVDEIQKRCIRSQRQIIPTFLFECEKSP